MAPITRDSRFVKILSSTTCISVLTSLFSVAFTIYLSVYQEEKKSEYLVKQIAECMAQEVAGIMKNHLRSEESHNNNYKELSQRLVFSTSLRPDLGI